MSKRFISVFSAGHLYLALLLFIPMVLISGQVPLYAGDMSVRIDVQSGSYIDTNYVLPIILENPTDQMLGGMEFAIRYDTAVFDLDSVISVPITGCSWDTYNYVVSEPGTVFILGIVEFDGDPECYFSQTIDTVFYLVMHAKNWPETSFSDFQFYWRLCSDNQLCNHLGDTVFISDEVIDYLSGNDISQEDALPTIHGLPTSCYNPENGKIIRDVDFYNGAVIFPLVDIGDLNLNNIPFEIADYIVYQSYYLYGDTVFSINYDAQVLASDCNADGNYPSVRDFIFFYRVIMGYVGPSVKDNGEDPADAAVFVQNTASKEVRLLYSDKLYGVHLIFDGEVIPQSPYPSELMYDYNGVATRMILSPNPGISEEGLEQGVIFSYTGNGILTGAEVADLGDYDIPAYIQVIGDEPVCGDVNYDEIVNISDAVYLISYIFLGGAAPASLTAADVNCDGSVNLADAIYLIRYVFTGSPIPCENCL